MVQTADSFPAVNTILSGPNWPGRVRVVRVEPRGASRVLVEAVTLDEQARLISRVFRLDELASLQVEATDHGMSLDGDPRGFKLAAEATRIRLAYTYDPQFAVSVAHIDPLPHQLEAVYHHMLRQPRIRFLLADDPGAGKTIMAGLLLKELKLRGAVTRTLIVAPANLAPQWQRELREKFDEEFDQVDRAALAARESRAWEISDQCVVSMDFAWRADVLESLARARRWDLIIVDEAHKMAAYQRGSKLERTRRYRLGELLTEHSEHLLLLTATPHKGDPDNFRLLLQLVDPDLFADTDILARAVQRQENPIFLRRLKEDMVDFDGRPLFPPRHVKTLGVELTEPEQALYEEVTRYVGETFNRALAEQNRNVTFALIVLQRRLASSVRAIRRSLENRRDRLAGLCDLVRADPELLAAAANGAVAQRPADGDEWEDLPEQERWQAEEQALRFTVARNLEELEAEVAILDRLARQALAVEQSGPERKLDELRRVMEQGGLLRPAGAAPLDGPEKLLIFTEAKDTLDYLCENLAAWGLSVISIDGTMAPPARYRAEQHFRDHNGAQVMVATEAAGEGINLQFCHLMINYDLPWNPTRLEQRMGRIHRYGQRYEVVVTNLVATSTREGMVWQALFHKLERMRASLGQDRVFDVIDQLLEGVSLEQLLRDALANLLTFEEVRERVLARLDLDQERRLEDATLTGLATRYVDLGRLRADRRQAAEARLVPAYIRDFFVKAMDALAPGRLDRRDDGFYRIPYVPAALRDVPDSLRRRTGLPADSYGAVTFDKADLAHTPGLTFVGPGHPLFEAVMHHVLARFGPDLSRGAVLVDTQSRADGLVWLLAGSVEDGLGRVAGKQLFALFQPLDGDPLRRIFPGRLIDFDPPPDHASSGGSQSPDRARMDVLSSGRSLRSTPEWADRARLAQARRLLADPTVVEEWSLDHVLEPYLHELQARRSQETAIVQDYLRRSFDVLIARSQAKLMDYERRAQRGVDMGLSLQDERRHLDELRRRQAQRLVVSQRAAALALGAPEIIGVALVTPTTPAIIDPAGGPAMRRSDAVEEAAMIHAMAMEQALGWQVEDVHDEDRGYDLVSYGPAGQVRYVEVKGRAGVGDVELSQNEWLKAQQLGGDYWLYVVSNALTAPDLQRIQNPTQRLSGDEVVERVRYRVRQAGWQRVAEEGVVWRTAD